MIKTKTKVIIAIIIALLGIFIFVNQFYEKKVQINDVEQNTVSNEAPKEMINTNTTKTTKKAKKVVKTTKKKTTQKKIKTASLSEYQKYAKDYGKYDDIQMECLINLWNRESGWNPNSVNKSSGACGIPQAYPCKKIKQTEGSNDWKAQIRWGVKYINYRYKTPCMAWQHFKNKHWY